VARSVQAHTAHGTAQGAHARCARPPPSNRAHRAPPYKGVRGGVRGRRGQPRAHRAPVGHPRVGEGWSADSSESQQRYRTAPSLALPGLSRYPTRTPAAASRHVQARNRRPPGHSGPLLGRPKASEACQRDTDAGAQLLAHLPLVARPRMGTQGTRVPGEPGRGPFALVRTARGAGSRAKIARDPAPLRYVGVPPASPLAGVRTLYAGMPLETGSPRPAAR
jgi:hypothetical protein